MSQSSQWGSFVYSAKWATLVLHFVSLWEFKNSFKLPSFCKIKCGIMSVFSAIAAAILVVCSLVISSLLFSSCLCSKLIRQALTAEQWLYILIVLFFLPNLLWSLQTGFSTSVLCLHLPVSVCQFVRLSLCTLSCFLIHFVCVCDSIICCEFCFNFEHDRCWI